MGRTNLPLPLGGSGPPSNICFLGASQVRPQTASRSVHPFLQGSRTWPTDRQTIRYTLINWLIDWLIDIYYHMCGRYLMSAVRQTIFTARRYASAVLAVIVCPSVRLSVCPSVTSRRSTKTAKPRITQATPYDSPGTQFSGAKNFGEIVKGSCQTGVLNRGGIGSNRPLSSNILLHLRTERCNIAT